MNAVNLGRTDCRFCGGEVLLDEDRRGLSSREYRLVPRHLRNALVADATCSECRAEYVAWLETNAFGTDYEDWLPRAATSFFRDLSHRSTMSSEPEEPDLPMFVIDHAPVRRTWPTCLQCGKRIFGGFGCKCPEPQPLRVVVCPVPLLPSWRDSENAVTKYDLFHDEEVMEFSGDEPLIGDKGEWATFRTLLEISHLVSLNEAVEATVADIREHWIDVALPPAGERAYSGDDRDYHAFIENIVNRASLVVEADPFGVKGPEAFELTPETSIDGGAGPWVNPKSAYVLHPHRTEYHWLAAYCWAYSKLPHHLIHIMHEQVEAFRGKRVAGLDQSEHWWASLENLKLVRPVAHCERNLPLGLQIGGLFIVDGAAFVAEDKRAPRMVRAVDSDDEKDGPTMPPDPASGGATHTSARWPMTTMVASFPNPPTPSMPLPGQAAKQSPNPNP